VREETTIELGGAFAAAEVTPIGESFFFREHLIEADKLLRSYAKGMGMGVQCKLTY